MVKCDDFVYIFHGERFAKRGAPVDKTLVLEQSLGNKFFEIVVGALTVSPLPRKQVNCPEKRGFSNSRSNFHHLYHHTSYLSWGYFFTACHDF
jgi:hypothetical protein